jgi:hypothetical protein
LSFLGTLILPEAGEVGQGSGAPGIEAPGLDPCHDYAMRKILTLTMSGLVTVLPLALTVYVIWWLVHTVEGWLRRALIALNIVSPEHYWPGLGQRVRRQNFPQILG